jgi:hypothetical protein
MSSSQVIRDSDYEDDCTGNEASPAKQETGIQVEAEFTLPSVQTSSIMGTNSTGIFRNC